MKSSYINHIAFLIDRSGSMQGREKAVADVFDSQIEYLAKQSKVRDQETRVSVYLFDTDIECLFYDKDVLRLPSLKGLYYTQGGTSLIDGTIHVLNDSAKIPELYCDHSHWIFVITDGEERDSVNSVSVLSRKIKNLAENYTMSILVPNRNAKAQAEEYGFPSDNIQVWDAVAKGGVEKVGETMRQATDYYFAQRSVGVRSTKNLFQVDASKLTTSKVVNKLDELSPNEYDLLPVRKDSSIKDYVESWLGKPYRIGSAYYNLSKKEVIQANKQIAVKDKINGRVYSGLAARTLLGLPNYEVKVEPASYGKYDIFVQSNSINRKLLRGTEVLVLK